MCNYFSVINIIFLIQIYIKFDNFIIELIIKKKTKKKKINKKLISFCK